MRQYCRFHRIERSRMANIRILFVDDEPDIREVVNVSLGLDREAGIRACASGADALVTATQWSVSFVLLDAF
jgi:two-component system OmpR family response regulator